MTCPVSQASGGSWDCYWVCLTRRDALLTCNVCFPLRKGQWPASFAQAGGFSSILQLKSRNISHQQKDICSSDGLG